MTEEANTEAMRQAFETFVTKDGRYTSNMGRRSDGRYIEPDANLAWRVWQAATRAAVPAWQPIETMPNDLQSRLFTCSGFIVQGFVDATGQLMVQSEIDPHWRKMRRKPSHWMPLPAAPEAP